LFELAHPAAVPKDWQNLEVLAPKGLSQSDFNAMDWDAVPKLDYASSQFRQLAIPEPARVIDSVHEFVMEDFGASQKVNSSKTMPVTEADAEAAPAQESATLEVHQSEIFLEPPEPMGGDAVPAPDLDMHAQDGDFLNCDEVPDLDPLVVEDLPAQESQALGEAEAPAPSLWIRLHWRKLAKRPISAACRRAARSRRLKPKRLCPKHWQRRKLLPSKHRPWRWKLSTKN